MGPIGAASHRWLKHGQTSHLDCFASCFDEMEVLLDFFEHVQIAVLNAELNSALAILVVENFGNFPQALLALIKADQIMVSYQILELSRGSVTLEMMQVVKTLSSLGVLRSLHGW